MSNAAKGGMLVPEATQIETVSGSLVDTLNPDPATIHVDDIAHALAMTCRYGGHVKRFYSVAEHAVLVYDLLEFQKADAAVRYAGLLHDAAEAYLGDIVSPLKFALRRAEYFSAGANRACRLDDFRGAYAHLSDRMETAIAQVFGVEADLDHDEIRLADMWALRIEAHELTQSRGSNWRWPGELPMDGVRPSAIEWAGGLPPDEARRLFHERVDAALTAVARAKLWPAAA